VLPTPFRNIPAPDDYPIAGKNSVGCYRRPNGSGGFTSKSSCFVRPRFYHLNDNQMRNTLLITTSYSGGRIVPFYGMFYDWQGAWVFQPGVTFVRDPFRFTTDYTVVEGAPTGQFGAVRDRDNIRFQVEYVF
jgi:hypothetical protein